MGARALYIVAYDIRLPSRLAAVLKLVRGYASGRQKSVFECYLTPTERRDLLIALGKQIDRREDRVLLLRHGSTENTQVLGKAVIPSDSNWFYIG